MDIFNLSCELIGEVCLMTVCCFQHIVFFFFYMLNCLPIHAYGSQLTVWIFSLTCSNGLDEIIDIILSIKFSVYSLVYKSV